MTLTLLTQNSIPCALVQAEAPVLTDAASALDILMQARYELDTKNIIIPSELVAEKFFILSSGLAGEVLQKYVNYSGRIAIFGDFTRYTSKPLHDFIYESNKGKDVFFVSNQEEALDCLTR